MDEHDFAELISAFLKGGDSDEESNGKGEKESDASADTEQSSREPEIRKNIIDSLAERIKESQGSRDSRPAMVATIENDATEKEIVDEVAGAGDIDKPETEDTKPAEASVVLEDKRIVTKEEVDTLLSGTRETETSVVQQALNRFTSIDGISAALVITRDGFTVEHSSSIEPDPDMVSAIVSTGLSVLDRIGHELSQGELQSAILEYEYGPIVISPLSREIMLVIVATQWTTLGRIRWEIKKQSDDLIASL